MRKKKGENFENWHRQDLSENMFASQILENVEIEIGDAQVSSRWFLWSRRHAMAQWRNDVRKIWANIYPPCNTFPSFPNHRVCLIRRNAEWELRAFLECAPTSMIFQWFLDLSAWPTSTLQTWNFQTWNFGDFLGRAHFWRPPCRVTSFSKKCYQRKY